MQPQAYAASYEALYICRSLSAAASLAFHNPSSFRGEAQEDPRERNYTVAVGILSGRYALRW